MSESNLMYFLINNNFFLSDGPQSRSGSQHGSRDNSAARNSSYSSRSLQMRPPQMQYNTLPLNSTSSSSSSQRGIRSDNKVSPVVCFILFRWVFCANFCAIRLKIDRNLMTMQTKKNSKIKKFTQKFKD